jgi:hypothetical protein
MLKHHKLEDILFWPDMKTSHYAKLVIDYLVTKNVDFVSKSENAPNVPQARGIEKFWALCKSTYGRRQMVPKSVRDF